VTEFLTFQLYGGISAWGKIAVGERRLTDFTPTKSAVVGMLGGALGVQRAEIERLRELQDSIGFAWLVEQPGTSLLDYHTTQRPVVADVKRHKPRSRRDALAIPHQETTLSTREYRENAFCRIAVWLRRVPSEPSLNDLRNALLRPWFSPYLGRRSCPLGLPRDPQIANASDPLEALRRHAANSTAWLRTRGILEPRSVSVLHFGFEDDFPTLVPQHTLSRRDTRISARPWQFRPRTEHRMQISPENYYAAEQG